MAGWPSPATLRAAGDNGPWPAISVPSRLRNAGYDQARAALTTMTAVGFRAPMIWIDVEPLGRMPWPTGTRSRQLANRRVLEGLMRGFADAGIGYGFYSYPRAWHDITGDWRLPLVPVWATAGRASRAVAIRRCSRRSFSTGPVLIAQWYDDIRDSDISCAGFRLIPPVPPTLSAASGNVPAR
jgi:hypothetical protein